jgi:hypothetical protein
MPADKKPAASKSEDLPKPIFGQFLAVGRHGHRVTSADGVTWSKPLRERDPHTMCGIAAGNGCVVAVGLNGGGENVLYRSSDLQKWDIVKKPSGYVAMMRTVCFGGDQFMAICSDGAGNPADVSPSEHHYSPDGITWTDRIKRKRSDGKEKGGIYTAVWGKDRWVGIGVRGIKSSSLDGRVWEDSKDMLPTETLIDLTYGKGTWVAGGLNGLRMASKDGQTWTAKQVGEEGEHLHAMIFTGKEFVGVGLGGTYFSPDGLTWTRKPNTNAPVTCAYGKGVFVGTAYRGRILMSKDAITWKDVAKIDEHLQAIAFV